MLAEGGWGKTLFEWTLRRITELCIIMYIFYSLYLWPCPVYSFVQSECRQRITCSLKWDKAATPGWGLPLVLEQPSQLPVCVWTGTSPLCSWPCGNWCPGPLETSRLRSPSLHIISLLILSLAACPPWAIFVLWAPSHVNEQSSRVVSTVSPQTLWLSTRKSCDLLKWHSQHLEVFSVEYICCLI